MTRTFTAAILPQSYIPGPTASEVTAANRLRAAREGAAAEHAARLAIAAGRPAARAAEEREEIAALEAERAAAAAWDAAYVAYAAD